MKLPGYPHCSPSPRRTNRASMARLFATQSRPPEQATAWSILYFLFIFTTYFGLLPSSARPGEFIHHFLSVLRALQW